MKKVLSFLIIIFFGLSISLSFASDESQIENINSNIQNATQKFYNVKNIQTEIEERLNPLKDKKATLETQLELFEEQINLSTTKIEKVTTQINQKRIEIAKLQEILERAKIEILDEKNLIFEFIKQLYLEEKRSYSNNTSSPELIKLLLSDKSISKSLQEIEYLNIMEDLSRKIFRKLDNASLIFIEKKNEIEITKNQLALLKNSLETERNTLMFQKQGREKLLEETKGKESIYQKLLAESKRQMEATISDITKLQENKEIIGAKLALLGIETEQEKAEKQKEMLSEMLKTSPDSDIYNIEKVDSDLIFSSPLMWPINPKKGLSSYYLDSDYEEYFGVKHHAIDIRTPQGTSIFAPASGYVQKIADNGNGYSYILLAHKDGLSTLYGHVSEILVKKDELVQIGQLIGKTGGTPGTKGAGTMTTGPHLHFEVHSEGKNKDPLDYLPLELLPENYRPKK